MDQTTIVNILTNSGLKVIGVDNGVIYFEDPSCLFPVFDMFLHYAWIVILILTGIMLFGWAVLYIIKGVKIDSVFHNAKALVLIFTVLSLVKPIVDVVYGDDLFSRQCDIKQVSSETIKELLDLREKNLGQTDEYLVENVDSTEINDLNQNSSPVAPTDIIEIKFQSSDKSTVYITSSGVKIKRGNTISTAWKNNNPGNIRATRSMQWLGAIGQSNGWCVFASEQDGINAMKKLLTSKNYYHLTLRGAIYKWAPAKDNNNPERYTNYVSRTADISPDKPMKDLNDYELENMVRAMQKFEGWIPGTEQKL